MSREHAVLQRQIEVARMFVNGATLKQASEGFGISSARCSQLFERLKSTARKLIGVETNPNASLKEIRTTYNEEWLVRLAKLDQFVKGGEE